MSNFPLLAYAALVLTFLAGIAIPSLPSRDAGPPAASTSTAQNAAPAPATKPPAVDFTDAQLL